MARWIGPALGALAGAVLASSAVVRAAELPPALDPADETTWRAAFIALDGGTAPGELLDGTVETVTDATLARVLEWRQLIDAGRFPEIAAFLADHPSWPERTTLRLNAERTLPEDATPEALAAFFDAHPPLTVLAAARYEEALTALDRTEDAERFLSQAWRRLPLTEDQLAVFVAYRPSLTVEDHIARFGRLISVGRIDEARHLLAYLPDGYDRVMDARLSLINDRATVNADVQAVPAALVDDPGLTFDRLRWRAGRGLLTGAIDLLNRQPDDEEIDRWWDQRRDIARSLVNLSNYQEGYRIAAGNRQTEGLARYQAELLSGWTALEHLGDAAAARDHFAAMREIAATPIGRATAAYWLARAETQLANHADAQALLDAAAAEPTTFYGQLAATAGGQATALADPPLDDAAAADFAENETARIVRQLHQIDQIALSDRLFFALLREVDSPTGYTLAARLALALDRPANAVAASDAAAAMGQAIAVSGWPTIDLPDGTPDPSVTLAVIRQESAFDPAAISTADARGLMQVLPSTAEEVADSLGLPFDADRLTEDPAYNIRLGATYMMRLMERYDGALVLAAAAYNAGASRVEAWMALNGDPRRPEVDLALWVESIPFNETRNYVQRIVEGEAVYRRLLSPPTENPG